MPICKVTKVAIQKPFLESECNKLEKNGFQIQIFDQLQDLNKEEKWDAIIIRAQNPFQESTGKKFKNLKAIISATSGFDHIDLSFCKKMNIEVFHTPDANSQSAHELTIGLLLSLVRNIPLQHLQNQKGIWERSSFGMELKDKTIGIIGLGRIGKKVSITTNSLGMKVIAYDPYIDQKEFSEVNALRVSYNELLKLSDVITFHVPLTKETHKMFNEKSIQETDFIYVINTSRGDVIDEKALVKGLQEGTIRGAALDVFEKEPLPKDSNLLKLKNVILTSHMGAKTNEAFENSCRMAVKQLLDFCAGDHSKRL